MVIDINELKKDMEELARLTFELSHKYGDIYMTAARCDIKDVNNWHADCTTKFDGKFVTARYSAGGGIE